MTPSLMPDHIFKERFLKVVGHLESLLKASLLPTAKGGQSAVGSTVGAVLQRHEAGEHELRDFDVMKLMMLADDLAALLDRPHLLREYRKRILSASIDEYIGVRFEMGMAAYLSRSLMLFHRGEPPREPDFVIAGPTPIGIECGSARVGRDAERPLVYKLEAAIREKGGKPYASRSVVLALEYSNLLYRSADTLTTLFDEEADRRYHAVLTDAGYGCLLLYSMLVVDGEYRRIYRRLDGAPTQPLADFLDRHFPRGDEQAAHWSVPSCP